MKLAFAYVTDARGFDLATYSAMSLALSQPRPCHIHIFCYRFTPVLSQGLAAGLAALGANLVFEGIGDKELEQHPTCLHVTTPSLLKLLAVERLVDSNDRVIYLDNDLLLFDDLKIDTINFGRSPVAAVTDLDPSDKGAFRHINWTSGEWRSSDVPEYFNTGFMVFDSNNWRTGEFYQKYAAALHDHDAGCRYKIDCTSIDQCALNIVFEKDWVKLPASYNMQAGAKFNKAWRTASVRHYGGPRKFVPIALFRNDGRDVRYLSTIRQAMGLPKAGFPLLYEILFRLNAARKFRSDLTMQNFLQAIHVRVDPRSFRTDATVRHLTMQDGAS